MAKVLLDHIVSHGPWLICGRLTGGARPGFLRGPATPCPTTLCVGLAEPLNPYELESRALSTLLRLPDTYGIGSGGLRVTSGEGG